MIAVAVTKTMNFTKLFSNINNFCFKTSLYYRPKTSHTILCKKCTVLPALRKIKQDLYKMKKLFASM